MYKTAHKEGENMDTKNQEFEYMEQPRHAKSLLTGLVLGGLVGAGTMLLFAPQSGAKTRASVQQGATHLRDQTSETVKETITQVQSKANQIKSEVQEKAEDLQHQGQDLLAKQLDRVSQAAEAGKKAIQTS
jgi:gas vesicle protein